jgi:MazG family protein
VGNTVATDSCFSRLIDLVETLRSDRGCPWDRAQTPEKIKIYLLEEAYEVLDALESGSNEEVCAELGDLLFHIVFLARLYEEVEAFDIEDVVRKIVKKMTHRHPHVFGQVQVNGVEDVKDQWQKIKTTEFQNKNQKRSSLLDGVPTGLPVLMRAYRLAERASRAGYNRFDTQKVLEKIDSKLIAFKDVLSKEKREEQSEKLGDLLFTITNLSRLIGVHPETALELALSKFCRRFTCIEKMLAQQGRTMASVSQDEMDALWKQCKEDL